MSKTRVEIAVGTVDGVNLTFFTQSPYVPNTVRVFTNGVAEGPECVIEINPSTGEVLLDPEILPKVGDTIMFLWEDAASAREDLQYLVEGLEGTITTEALLEGYIEEEQDLHGELSTVTIEGAISDELSLHSDIASEILIVGTICCE